MNWKDTVMSPKKIRRLWSTPNILGEANLAIAQAQAEITWPIAFRAGQKEPLIHVKINNEWRSLGEGDSVDFDYSDAYKAGIKEVVEWASRYEEPYVEFGEAYFPRRIEIPIANWQAKLKEWEINYEQNEAVH